MTTRVLMEPGPTQVDPRVIQAMCRPVVYHQSREFFETVDVVCEQLQRIYQTAGEIVVLPATGRGGIEAALGSVREPDQILVIPTNGSFGRMMANIGRAVGLNVVELPFGPGEPILRADVEEALGRYDKPILGIVHNETSTGMVNDISGYGAAVHRRGGLFVVDTVSSLGGVPVQTDLQEIDLCVSASQKSIGALAGLSFVSVSPRATEQFDQRSSLHRGMYLDLRRWWEMWLPTSRGGKLTSGYRRLPWSMPTHLVFALQVAAEVIFEEGLHARWSRHERAGVALRNALVELGLKPVPAAGWESATVTAMYGGDDLDVNDVRAALSERHGIGVAGGLDDLNGKIFRIGHMAETARFGPQVHVVSALAYELEQRGIKTGTYPIEALITSWGEE